MARSKATKKKHSDQSNPSSCFLTNSEEEHQPPTLTSMAKNPPDERLVYLALQSIFKGENSKIRNAKPIRKLVSKHSSQLEIRNLIQEYNVDVLCNVAKTLLEEQIFESTLKAKIRFPEVFEVSPSQSAERAISEKEAARSELVAIEHVMRGQQDGGSGDGGGVVLMEKGKGKEVVGMSSQSFFLFIKLFWNKTHAMKSKMKRLHLIHRTTNSEILFNHILKLPHHPSTPST